MTAAVVAMIVAAAALAGCRNATSAEASVDLSREPQVTYNTNSFPVGATYTLGGFGLPDDVARPAVLTGVEVIHTGGLEVVGAAAFDGDTADTGIGLVPGWPPDLWPGVLDPAPSDTAWDAEHVSVVVGIRTLEPISALRGVRITWRNGHGNAGSAVMDHAVVTCAADTVCESDDMALETDDWVLARLGLYCP